MYMGMSGMGSYRKDSEPRVLWNLFILFTSGFNFRSFHLCLALTNDSSLSGVIWATGQQ